MLQLGLLTPRQYSLATKKRRMAGSGVAFTLLQTSDPPTQEEVLRFEEISYGLRTSNGTTRMTFRNRMPDVNQMALSLIRASYQSEAEIVVQDRAASTCLTSTEWAKQLLIDYPRVQFEASDTLLNLFVVSLEDGGTFIVEPNGQPLQYIESPFAVCLSPREPLRYLLNHLVVLRGRKRFRSLALREKLFDLCDKKKEYGIGKISCVHPEALALSENDPRFTVRVRSIFEATPGVDVLRTMNILNFEYFSTQHIINGISAAFHSVRPGGLWVVGRTLKENGKNHATFFRRKEENWEILDRIGSGSEIEKLVTDNLHVSDERK
jgi:hypothetical protein